jgi:amino acid adenylation domain-containing protein
MPSRTVDEPSARFGALARSDPSAPCLLDAGRSWDRRETERRIASLAADVLRAGGGPGSVVGVLLPRSVWLPVALLAVLRAGAAYVPLGPDHPEQRLAEVAADAGARLVVTTSDLAPLVSRLGLAPLVVDADGAEGTAPAPTPRAPADLAYIIPTSGSTGRPKSVAIGRDSLVDYLAALDELVGGDRQQTWLAVTDVTFDIAVTELLWTVTRGHRVVVTDNDVVSLVTGPLASREPPITHLQCTPSFLRLLAADEDAFAGVAGADLLMVGGEAFPVELLDRLLAGGPTRILNVYGPTEATVWVTAHEVSAAAPPVPIGKAFGHVRLHVLDAGGRPVAPGQEGVLHIGGSALARGYVGNPVETARRFVPDPFGSEPGARLYDTGDVTLRGEDGQLYVLGRRDDQVKVRGFRVELGEIETNLLAHPAVRAAAALAVDVGDGDTLIHAHVVAAPDDATGIREAMTERLPPYMVPSRVFVHEALPLTPAGKVDRRTLARHRP